MFSLPISSVNLFKNSLIEKKLGQCFTKIPAESHLDKFEICEKSYSERFDSQDIFKTNFSGPMPFGIFSNKQDVFITLYNVRDISINLKYYSNYIKWILNTSTLSINCEQVKGNGTMGDSHKLVIMLKCPVERNSDISNEAHVKMVNTNTSDIVQFTNLPICNENDNFDSIDLAICTQLADDHLIRLPEWVEYHRLIGFQRIYIYVDSPHFSAYKFFMDGYMKRHPNFLILVPFYFTKINRQT